MATRTLVLHCPDWPVTAAGVDPGVPAAVVEGSRVVAASRAARAEGVRAGLVRREAEARCPGLVVLTRDQAQEARAFEAVVVAVESLCPNVEVTRPGTCALATKGPSRYFGGDRALAGRVGGVVDAVLGPGPATVPGGVPPASPATPAAGSMAGAWWRVGVADGPFAAGLAARQATIVPPGGSPAYLAAFPVEALARPELAALLVRLGVRTLGQLGALPEADVLARFGPDGALAHRLARGLDERPLVPRVPGPELVATAELDPPADRLDRVAFLARALAQDLHGQLSGRGLACTRLQVEAETEHGEGRSRLWRHDDGFSPAAMVDRVRWQLDGWLNGAGWGPGHGEGPTAGISLLRLAADEVVVDRGRQSGLWGQPTEAGERAGRALARVQGMLGPDAVVTAVAAGGRGPAEQVRMVPWGEPCRPTAGPPAAGAPSPRRPAAGGPARPAGSPAGAGSAGTGPWPGRIPSPSPAVVHSRPPLAEVVDAQGRPVEVTARGMLSAAPAGVAWAGQARLVDGWGGPWPADERWWDASGHRRRARLQVLLDDGSAHLLVVEGGRWRVEATYD